MKRRILLYGLLLMCILPTFGQQTSQYKYHIFEDYLLNPGYVGMKNYYPVLVGRDQRFYGLSESSPQTYYLSLHSRVGEGYLLEKDGKINKFFEKFGNIALGFQLLQYSYGPSRETNIGLTYGYHIDMNQHYKKKNPRKLVLAFTPRLKRLGFNYNDLQLYGGELGGNGQNFYDPQLGDLDHLRSWMFTTDVGAVYKTVHGEFGLGALDIVQSKNKLETEQLYLNDSVSFYTYDSLYPPKFMVNTKLTFIEMYSSPNLDVNFIPAVTAMYAPKTGAIELIADVMMEGIFRQHVAGLRSEVVMVGQLGLNIYHSRVYEPGTFLQPYLSFDFKNFTLTYAQTILIDNDLTSAPGVSPGNQISILFKLSNDRTVRGKVKSGAVWTN